MGIRRRGFHRSFVVTVVAGMGSVASACGGGSTADPATAGASQGGSSAAGAHAGASSAGNGSSAGGSSANLGGGSALASSGAAGKPLTSAGSAGTDADPRCPASMLEAFSDRGEPECADAGLICHLPVDCTGGPERLTVTCKDQRWQAGAVGCDHPWEYCESSISETFKVAPYLYCEDGDWAIGRYIQGLSDQGGVGCPPELPTGPCVMGSTGGSNNFEHCGYPCGGDSQEWTIVSCVAATTPRNLSWSSDGACKGSK